MSLFQNQGRFSLESAFDAWLAGFGSGALDWMVNAALPDLAPQTSWSAATACVRAHVRSQWRLRGCARKVERAVVARALRGRDPMPPWESGSLALPVLPGRFPTWRRQLAEAMDAGEAAALPPLFRKLAKPFGGERLPQDLGQLVELAGRVCREAGALEDACEAFSLSRCSGWWWVTKTGLIGAGDMTLDVAPFRWTRGLPTSFAPKGRGRPPVSLSVFDIERLTQLWSAYDHVIGCGTTIRRETLDLVHVPREKQHIIEWHRSLTRPPIGHLPRLSGRVVVVDDVHEGESAFSLAKLYRGAVVSLGAEECVRFVSGGEALVCEIGGSSKPDAVNFVEPLLAAELWRPRPRTPRDESPTDDV